MSPTNRQLNMDTGWTEGERSQSKLTDSAGIHLFQVEIIPTALVGNVVDEEVDAG